MKPLSECRLYTFVDSSYLRGRDPVLIAEQLCMGGADLIQLRAKDWPASRVAEVGRDLLEVTRRHAVRLVINDHLAVAREIGAEVCHLGQEDFFDAGHRHVSELVCDNSDLLIGLSSHAPAQAERAMAAGAAYVAVGPVFATGTKPLSRPVTLEYVRWAAENINLPWFAIGGITLGNLRQVLEAGANRICVVSAILDQADVAGTCRLFRTALEKKG